VEQGSLMAGQSVEFLREEASAAEIVAELTAQARSALVERQPILVPTSAAPSVSA
jgi:hypothetical protein